MIKASLPTLLPVYHKLFNTVLNLGTVPKNWCNGLITPIFKSGVRNDPSNYRGICVSSCLGKLFFSILNQRLLEHVTSLNILHKSQIGFLPKNRTSDHLLTLRTLIEKYVHCHGEKAYACFVDFRKAFDSHCQKLGTRWRLRVRTKATMAANSHKKMYGDKETFSNTSIMSSRVFGARLETC